MPTSPDGILQAEFDPAWAAVRLIVDGGMWPAPVDTITVTRRVLAAPEVHVRGIESRVVAGGYFVGSDTEMDLESLVTYRVDGYGSGALVASASVLVDTSGAAPGLWVKVPGLPDLTTHARLRGVSEVTSRTIGGVYQIAGGGGAVAQTTAQWSGIETDSATVELSAKTGTEVVRLRATLAQRVLLLQPVGSSDLDAGWYYVDSTSRSNPAGVESYGRRRFTLDVQRTSVPAGTGQGIPGVTWAAVLDAYDTWADLVGAKDTWFDVLQGV